MDKILEVEKSIIKKYRKYTWGGFVSAIKEYNLIEAGDRVLVDIDSVESLLLAKCLQELKKHGKIVFELCFCTTEKNADRLIYLLNDRCDKIATQLDKKQSVLNFAIKNKCNTIAKSEYFEQVTVKILKSLLFDGEIKAVLPKKIDNLKIISPMINVSKKGINLWARNAEIIDLIKEEILDKNSYITKQIIEQDYLNNKLIELNIFSSVKCVNLETAISYIKNGKTISFLDEYEILA